MLNHFKELYQINLLNIKILMIKILENFFILLIDIFHMVQIIKIIIMIIEMKFIELLNFINLVMIYFQILNMKKIFISKIDFLKIIYI